MRAARRWTFFTTTARMLSSTPVAKFSPQGAAQDADFLGTGRHILHPRGRRGVPERPSERRNASARVWSFRCRRLSRPNRGEYASLLRRAGCSQSGEEGLAKAVVVGFERNGQAVWRNWLHSMRVVSLNCGLPREVQWHGRIVTTAIYKQPVVGRVALRKLNLDGDRQADLTVHGGEAKAVD